MLRERQRGFGNNDQNPRCSRCKGQRLDSRLHGRLIIKESVFEEEVLGDYALTQARAQNNERN